MGDKQWEINKILANRDTNYEINRRGSWVSRGEARFR